jgi:malonyl-CoA O-methyltransferase
MNVRDAYNVWSATYDTDRNLTRDLDQQVIQRMLSELRCRSILEIGCGTGKNTAFLAQIGGQVRCLDFSEGMIRQARAKSPAGNVSFAVADLTRSWPCADRSADLIVCDLVLEHIADLSFIFMEAYRCLSAGGHLFVCELHPFRQYLGSKAGFQQGEVRVEIPAFVHHTSEFVDGAITAGLMLTSLKEWWHDEDQQVPPRLISFMFQK